MPHLRSDRSHGAGAAQQLRPGEEALRAVVANGRGIWREAGVRAPAWLSALQAPSVELIAILSTRRAYAPRTSLAIAAGLEARLALAAGLVERVRTALHEALLNAVTHGNLGLASAMKTDAAGLETFERLAEAGLAAPARARAPVGLALAAAPGALVLSVHDDGEGFSVRGDAKAALHGRGLAIIACMADRLDIRAGGRLIRMEFDR